MPASPPPKAAPIPADALHGVTGRTLRRRLVRLRFLERDPLEEQRRYDAARQEKPHSHIRREAVFRPVQKEIPAELPDPALPPALQQKEVREKWVYLFRVEKGPHGHTPRVEKELVFTEDGTYQRVEWPHSDWHEEGDERASVAPKGDERIAAMSVPAEVEDEEVWPRYYACLSHARLPYARLQTYLRDWRAVTGRCQRVLLSRGGAGEAGGLQDAAVTYDAEAEVFDVGLVDYLKMAAQAHARQTETLAEQHDAFFAEEQATKDFHAALTRQVAGAFFTEHPDKEHGDVLNTGTLCEHLTQRQEEREALEERLSLRGQDLCMLVLPALPYWLLELASHF